MPYGISYEPIFDCVHRGWKLETSTTKDSRFLYFLVLLLFQQKSQTPCPYQATVGSGIALHKVSTTRSYGQQHSFAMAKSMAIGQPSENKRSDNLILILTEE